MFLVYKYRIKSHQGVTLLAHARAVNQVWNYCVETQRNVQKIKKQGGNINWLSRFTMQALASGTSKEIGIHGQTIQNICEQFVQSRDQHKKCPKFRKSFGSGRSLGWIPFQQQSRQITKDSVTYLGKTYKFFGAKRRPLPKNAKGGYFVEDARGRWYVCFQVEVENDTRHGQREIGIDLGLKDLAVTSDGEKIGNPKYFRKEEEKLKKAQRANNKKRVKAIHEHIKNSRADYLHKMSARLVRESKLIVVGNVNSSNLMKTRMSKSVADSGWSMFRNMLCYKASRHGVRFQVVDEKFTTQTCSQCGCLPPGRPKGITGLGIRDWVCSECGASHDRDVNSAKNILMIGLSVQPPVGENQKGK